MAHAGAQPERSKSSKAAAKSAAKPSAKPAAKAAGKPASKPGRLKGLQGDPAGDMNASFNWSGSGVTITFPAADIYADATTQSWTWNSTTKQEASTTRSDSFTSANATGGNTLTVVQTRPSGNVTFQATGITRNTASASLSQQ